VKTRHLHREITVAERRTIVADPWIALRQERGARIALGRAGSSLPSGELLRFAAAHAEARDAVHSELDATRLEAALRPLGCPIVQLHSAASDRLTYLQRPDLGRRLDEASRNALTKVADAECDVAIIIADGLSALAVERHAPPLLELLTPQLRQAGLRLGPIAIVRQARVAIEDEIGQLLRAAAAVILIGERPGLSCADSLGAYLVFGPTVGNTDSLRNCVSNIRPDGLAIPLAVETIRYLLTEALRRRISGVGLKDERGGHLAASDPGCALPGLE
jgi:ethanolamine ammonia-lyase small subunit